VVGFPASCNYMASIRTDGNRFDVSACQSFRTRWRVGGQIPYKCETIPCSGNQGATIRAEREAPDRALVPSKQVRIALRIWRLEIPQSDRGIAHAARRQPPPIWAENRRRPDSPGVVHTIMGGRWRGQLPKINKIGVFPSNRRYPLPIWAEDATRTGAKFASQDA